MKTRLLAALVPAILFGQDALPRLSVAYFDAPSCPAGWAPYSPASGRAIVPVAPPSGILAQVGRALASGENRTHSHAVSGSINTGSAGYLVAAGCCNTSLASGGSKTFRTETAGAGSSIPYVQMLACQKRVEPEPAPIPLGTTIFYEGLSCPSGWSTVDAMQGYFPVASPAPAGPMGGARLQPREDRTHTHNYIGSINLTAQSIISFSGGLATGYALAGEYNPTGRTAAASTGFPYLQLLQCSKDAAGPPRITSIVNGASFTSNAIAPGEIVAIFGSNLGPDAGAGAELSGNRLSTEVADVRVTFDGRPAAILFASAGQVNVQVPYRVEGTVDVRVVYQDQFSNVYKAPVAASAPGLFSFSAPRSDEAIAVLGSELASASRPVPVGVPFVLYATGEGLTNPGSEDGRPRGTPLALPIQPVRVTVGGVDATIEYAGAAPGFVGLMQINARLNPGTPSGKAPIVLTIGAGSSARGVNLWVE